MQVSEWTLEEPSDTRRLRQDPLGVPLGGVGRPNKTLTHDEVQDEVCQLESQYFIPLKSYFILSHLPLQNSFESLCTKYYYHMIGFLAYRWGALGYWLQTGPDHGPVTHTKEDHSREYPRQVPRKEP